MIVLEGNNGGDIFQLEQLPDDRIHLKVGHCCVYVIDHVLPVEWLTGVLGNLLAAQSVQDALRGVDWPKDYLTELGTQIIPYREYAQGKG